MKSDLVDLELIVHFQTEKAVLVSKDETSKQIWLPKSLIELERVKGSQYIVTLPENIALDRELI